jgi:transposase
MKTIPLDTRSRILARYDTGRHTRQEVAELFGVSLGLVKKILCQRKQLGHIKPLRRSGRKPTMTPARMDVLRALLREKPGLTLAQMRELLGGACSGVCIHLALKKMRVTYKKKRYVLPSRTVKTCARRARHGWR